MMPSLLCEIFSFTKEKVKEYKKLSFHINLALYQTLLFWLTLFWFNSIILAFKFVPSDNKTTLSWYND